MKKALIIAACALIAGLIIGATTSSKVIPAGTIDSQNFLNQKCVEEVKKASDCMQIQDKHDKSAEFFLREKRRTTRRAYA
jgi:hypothetical protein